MFINLTNHPVAGWSEDQLKAAKAYGEVIDFKFPDIEPFFSSQEINDLADATVDEIMELDTHLVVHIMGEMTFTYAVVFRLKAKGITCVASTTERLVKMLPNGKKLSEFKFVQFREY